MDRNTDVGIPNANTDKSLSARRAWIEMIITYRSAPNHTRVALRKESVDRNAVTLTYEDMWLPSLSARRAWIEMR